MHILFGLSFYLLLSFFFVSCDSNINSFNIDVAGKVDYIKNNTPDTSSKGTNTGSNTNTNTNTNTGSNTNTNTGSNTNTNTGSNTNTNTNTGSNTNTGNNTANTSDITANLGSKVGERNVLEVSPGSGIPVTAGETITVEEYSSYFVLRYSTDLTKVKHSNDITAINTEGEVSKKIAKVPSSSKFIKIYFMKDGDSVSKIFEIPTSSLPRKN